MKKIENSVHYYNILKFEEFKIILIVEEAWMNSDSVIEKTNIVWAFKERSEQQENCNNQDSKFTNNNNQSNNQFNSQSN